MTLDRFLATLIVSMITWAAAYKYFEAYPLPVATIGFMVTCLLIFLFTREQETLRKSFKLVDQHVMKDEIRKLAAVAHIAINTASEEQRKHLLGIRNDKKNLKEAEKARDVALTNFKHLRDAAVNTGNSIVGSSIKDFID